MVSIRNTWTKNAIYSILFAIAQVIFVLYICGPQFFTDSPTYISTANFIMTGSGTYPLFRLLIPLAPVLSILFTPFVGSVANGLLAENCMFFILSSVLIFLIAKEIYNDARVSLYSSIIFSSSWIVLMFGLAIMTDVGAYFFIILDIFLILIYFKNPFFQNYKFLALIGLICGIGILMKENSVVGALFFVFMLLLSKNDIKIKIEKLLVFSFAFLIPIIINSAIIYYLFNYSYLDLYLRCSDEYTVTRNYIYLLYEFGFVFNVIFPFFMIGLYNEVKNKVNLKIYICLIISSFIPLLLWPALNESRFVFVVFIGLIPLSAYGVKLFCDYFDTSATKISPKILGLGIVSAYVFVNMSIRFALSYYGCRNFVEIVYSLLP